MKIVIIILALMIVLQKYYSDKAIKHLERRLQAQEIISSQLVNSTSELLDIDKLIIDGMIRQIVAEMRAASDDQESLNPES